MESVIPTDVALPVTKAEPGKPTKGAKEIEISLLYLTLKTLSPDGQLLPDADAIERDLFEGQVVKLGRLANRSSSSSPVAPHKDFIWFKNKVVSRTHASIHLQEGHLYLKDLGSSSGTFLNGQRLSLSGRESSAVKLKPGDRIQLGVDYQGRTEEIYKCVNLLLDAQPKVIVQKLKKANQAMYSDALKTLLAATNPYSTQNHEQDSSVGGGGVDCCICLCTIGPFQALFVAPCSHCFHYKCASPLLGTTTMFLCPLCRQVANLAASVSVENLAQTGDGGTPSTAL